MSATVAQPPFALIGPSTTDVIDVDALDDVPIPPPPSASSSNVPASHFPVSRYGGPGRRDLDAPVPLPRQRTATRASVARNTNVIVIDSDSDNEQPPARPIIPLPRRLLRPPPNFPAVLTPRQIRELAEEDDELYGRVQRRRLSPPYHIAARSPPPPVPPVPIEFRNHRAPAQRFGNAGGIWDEGLVRPLDRPYDFETNMISHHQRAVAGPSNNNINHRGGPTAAAAARPRLGGALWATANNTVPPVENHAREGGLFSALRAYMDFGRTNSSAENPPVDLPPHPHHHLHHHGHEDEDENDDFDPTHAFMPRPPNWAMLGVPNPMFNVFGNRRKEGGEDAYKKEYTHPSIEPGFVADFARREDCDGDDKSDDENGKPQDASGKWDNPIVLDDAEEEVEEVREVEDAKEEEEVVVEVKPKFLLVCGMCKESLVLTASMTGEEQKRRKNWALRCGHVICGGCIASISIPMQPHQHPGKGKEREIVHRVDRSANDEVELEHGYDDIVEEEPPEDYRYHLRARPIVDLGPHRKRVHPKSAMKQKPVVEERFTWSCTVSGCGREHDSVRVKLEVTMKNEKGKGKGKGKAREVVDHHDDGVEWTEWGPDTHRGRGAIGLFV